MTQVRTIECDVVTQNLGEKMREETAEFLSSHLRPGRGDGTGWPSLMRFRGPMLAGIGRTMKERRVAAWQGA